MLVSLLALSAGLLCPLARGRGAWGARGGVTQMSALRDWLEHSAGIAPQFLDKVVASCDEQMVGSVANLRTLSQAGMLGSVFKPVVAASIEAALLKGSDTTAAPAAPAASSTFVLPLAEVKRRLRANAQETWGSEAELRKRLSMFAVQEALKAAPVEPVSLPPTLTPPGPPPPANGPINPSALAPTPSAPPPAPVPAPAAPPPTVAAPPPASPPPAASDKSTFTVKLLTPDGELVFECPPDQFILDQTDEEEGDGFAELPYACRAGSCSACAGKIISGTVDGSASSFLNDEQRANGYILTCTAKPTSDCVIQTHVEEELF